MTDQSTFVEGRSSPLEALPIQYADYAVWQREQLQGPLLERQLGYWKTQLAELGPMQITTDSPRPFSQSFRGAQHHFSLPGALTRALKELALREHVTLFMALLAAFQILISRYSRQEDVVIGRYIKEQEKQKLR